MKEAFKKILISVVVFFMAYIPTKGVPYTEIRFVILPRLSTESLYGMFKPLAEYLSKETGEKVSIIIPKDFNTFKEIVKNGQVDIGFANPVIYVQVKKDADLNPLALASESKGGTKFRGIIIARKDSGIDKVQDLKGKRLIFVEKDSAAGYIFQVLLLSKAGMDIHKDFVTLPFAMKHDNVTMKVFNKEADAGGIREDDFEKMKNKVDLTQLKIVAYSDYFPNWPLFGTSRLNKGISEKIRAALLKLKPGEVESERILNAAKLSGFVPVSDKDYDQLRQAARLAGAF